MFNVLYYHIKDVSSDRVVELFSIIFRMRKWVENSSEKPAFFALGIGGTPLDPDYFYFSRFFNFDNMRFHPNGNRGLLINQMRFKFFDKVIRDEFNCIHNPS